MRLLNLTDPATPCLLATTPSGTRGTLACEHSCPTGRLRAPGRGRSMIVPVRLGRLGRSRPVGLLLLALAVGVPWASADQTYIIKKNDTLTLIARQFGVRVSDLARHNKLTLNSTIYAGRRLVIPSKETVAAPVLSCDIRAAIQGAAVRKGRWKYIVLHHSGTPSATMRAMDNYHRNTRHMENGLAYHFVIGNGKGIQDGDIEVTRRWTRQLNGGHLASDKLNAVSLGICLVGNFDQTPPTPRQMDSLVALVEALRRRCNLRVSAVKTHQQIHPGHTRCPGRLFDMNKLVKRMH
ncbi:MAG: N-acetylmuramoyl-L-alanine amidase [Verrucomicrobia bacterium]|nr:N-acetylmuramoyl-L-alanine amidase [Verrucomicrobiota bacterium]